MSPVSDLTPPTDSDAADSRPPSGGNLAKIMVGAVIIVVMIVVALVYQRSVAIHEPTSAVVIEGDRSLDGAKIVVEENAPTHRSWTVLLNHDNHWKTPVLLDPGDYKMTVTHAGHSLFAAGFTLGRYQGWNVPLPCAVRIIGNPAVGDVIVNITNTSPAPDTSSRIEPAMLDEKNEFHTTAYLTPGSYHIVATHAGATVYDGKLNVDRTSISRIDLTKPANAETDDGGQ
ncbi:MAG: hypothetical protein JWN24_96 [Phycisphaerales bacterium]|nr:hypothetical protein [Phycisphaerales bacterium]